MAKLALYFGPGVPRPAPRVVMDALRSVQVTSRSTEASGFQLTFSLSTSSPLHTLFLVAGGSMIPVLRVVIAAQLAGRPEVLIDGVVTNQEVSPGEGGAATLTVTGEDLSRVMDYFDFSGIPYPSTPDFARVLLVLAKYAALGVIPKVIPSKMINVKLPTEKIPRQKGNDLAYIQLLAEEAGYTFYMEPGDVVGTSYAYWGPHIKVGRPQPALNVNMDAMTNVQSLSFNFNPDSGVAPTVPILIPLIKTTINVPIPQVSLFSPPLALIPPLRKRDKPIETSKKTIPEGITEGAAEAEKAQAAAATATGSLEVVRYGRLLKPRKLVGVRGGGLAFDGLWYVDEVTTDLMPGEFKQSFKLSRNGLVSNVPRVPT